MTNPKRGLLKIVADTNLIISGLIIKRGYPYQLLSKWKKQDFILLTSKEQRDELIDVVMRLKIVKDYNLSKQEVMSIIFLLDTAAIRINPDPKLPVEMRDPKDEKILGIALTGGADYLLSGDKDLLILNGNPKLKDLKIMTAKQFLNQ